MEKSILRVKEESYPNPSYSYGVFGVFFMGTVEIGRADKQPGGWVVFGKRKVLATAEMAAKVMLDDKLNRLQKEERDVRKMLDDLRVHCGGQLPAKM